MIDTVSTDTEMCYSDYYDFVSAVERMLPSVVVEFVALEAIFGVNDCSVAGSWAVGSSVETDAG